MYVHLYIYLLAIQVHPPIATLKKNVLSLDPNKNITLPVLRNIDKVEAEDELWLDWQEGGKKRSADFETLRDRPKAART